MALFPFLETGHTENCEQPPSSPQVAWCFRSNLDCAISQRGSLRQFRNPSSSHNDNPSAALLISFLYLKTSSKQLFIELTIADWSLNMGLLHALVARVPLIAADKKGPVVNLVSWVSLTTMCLAVITVLVSKLLVLRRLKWNDSVIIAALVRTNSSFYLPFSTPVVLTSRQQVVFHRIYHQCKQPSQQWTGVETIDCQD